MLFCSRCKEELNVFLKGEWQLTGYSINTEFKVSLAKPVEKAFIFSCPNCGNIPFSEVVSYCFSCREFYPLWDLYPGEFGNYCSKCDPNNVEVTLETILRRSM